MPEISTIKFTTTLASAISTITRPTTISVSATQSVYGSGTFSILIFDLGTDVDPIHGELLKVTGGGATTTWTVDTEVGSTPLTHANGSTVVATVLTPRALAQPLVDHTTPGTTPDPHSGYVLKSNYTAKGDLLVGTGAGTFTRQLIGADGTSPLADSTAISGFRWVALSLSAVMTHMGDLAIGGLLGAVQRLGIGTIGQGLVTVQNALVVADPISGPSCSAVSSGGALVNATSYDFAFAWQSPNASPDGGITLASPVTTFSATSTGVVAVQAPAAPSPNLTLVVYAALHSGTLQQQGTLANANTGGTNTINVSSIAGGANPSATNTTGGLGPAWGNIGSVTSVAMSVPSEFSITGSPITSAGTLTIAKGNQSANAIYAGPITGSAVVPAFRQLDPLDIPVTFIKLAFPVALKASANIITSVTGTPPTGRHEEFTPAAGATTIAVSLTPLVILIVAVNGVVKSVASGNYSVLGATITFSPAFSAGDRVVVSYMA